MADETRRITIGHLYPDLLNLYGDRGNTITLVRRSTWRGIEANVIDLGVGKDADFSDIDLFFIGGGQDFDQRTLLDDLGVGRAGSKAARLKDAVEDGVPVLAICGGYQILGEYYCDHEGVESTYIGAIPAYTQAGEDRLISNMVFAADAVEGTPSVVGFENHAGRTRLREGAHALGHVLRGYGNNGEDGTEGLRYKNVLATYAHGPLLPKNPAIADELLGIALGRRHPGSTLPALDDALEHAAHDMMVARLGIR